MSDAILDRKSGGRPWLRATLLLLLLTLVAVLIAGWWWLRGSLPILEGERRFDGLTAPVSILRDSQGVPTISGTERNDIAYALGFLHAQERFFQMDLLRRNSAGEMSLLFGPLAANYDKRVRQHRFRARAARNVAMLPARQRKMLSAYTRGVNAGLDDQRSKPFEYALLRLAPATWQEEDSVLVLFSMFLDLQDSQARFERGMGFMSEVLPPDLFAFFSQQGGKWDAPLLGAPLPPVPIPQHGFAGLLGKGDTAMRYRALPAEDQVVGSNNWAVAGKLSAHGGAILADDMHLAVQVPNIWYRAFWTNPDTARLVGGVTLPGSPLLLAGSNGRFAWGYTNTQGDWSDVVVLETSADGSQYRTPEGFAPFVEHRETIDTGDGENIEIIVRETRWGPVIGSNHQGELLALRWVAHDPEAANLALLRLETVDSVADAIGLGPGLGMPHQNLLMADDQGNIGWTVAGPIPRRLGFDGRLPQRWGDGGFTWDGYRDGDDHPRIYQPDSGRLWSANARTMSGNWYRVMGGSGSALGARQQHIRDALFAADEFNEGDMLALQLDDRALFLSPWRDRLLDLLDADTAAAEPALGEARQRVESWSGRAAREDVGYRLVRQFRRRCIELVTAPLVTVLEARDPNFNFRFVSRQIEYPVWAMLSARPAHLLNPDFASWRELELAAIRQVLEPLFDDGTLSNDSWGELNRLQTRHPLADVVPPIDWWLSMPKEPMDGDTHMPRVQAPVHGASERFVVSPGREELGIFHMATGQSAHPLSPFFGNGHRDWVEGRPSPWLPGETAYRLQLLPR